MPDSAANLRSADYDIRVAEDQLTATVRIEPGGLLNATHLIEQLHRTGIQFIDTDAIAATAQRLRDAKVAAQQDPIAETLLTEGVSLIVARGKPSVEDVPERLIRIEPPPPAEPPASHYERVQLITVQPQEAIATITPAVIGRDGIDVFGRPIVRKRLAQAIAAGEGAIRTGDLMLADRAGRVTLEGSRIRVEPRLDIKGDVSFATGNIRFNGDIDIRGNVLDLFLVQGSADVHVGGTIEAAQVQAGGNLIVRGGVTGKDKGRITVGGKMACRYISNSTLQVGDDLTVHGEIANSTITCGGRLNLDAGRILASHITANGGVHCDTLGNQAFAKTTIDVGTDLILKQLANELLPQLHRGLHQARYMKDIADALLRDPKRLTEKQREEATQLLYRVAKTDGDLSAKLAAFRERVRLSQESFRPEVVVTGRLFPGVTIRLPGLEATVTTPFAGPLKIVEARGARRNTITVVNLQTESVVPLISYPTARDQCAELREILEIAA